jgi:endonuclease/exonuclease/phosphatase family metal-dependent hydrolase
MRIICLNGWGGKLHESLLPWLAAAKPDILCLQEVVHTPRTTTEWLTYRDGSHILPQRANLHREIATLMPGHAATFCPAAQGVLWDDDGPVPSQWGIATYVRSTLPIIGQAQGFVHKSFSPDGYGDHPRSRSAHAVRVWDSAQGRAVTVAHMHGLRDPAGKADTPARRDQALRFAALLSSVAEPGDLSVVCGDFNVEPDSETLTILSGLGLTELVTSRGFAGTRTSHYTKPGRHADYMLVGGPVTVARFDVMTTPEVSDHCPLLLEI